MQNKTIIYYSANKINPFFANKVIDQIRWASNNEIPIISITQKPMKNLGTNVCVGDIGQSLQNIYYQILKGLLLTNTKYVICCEDDTFYLREHFEYIPKMPISYNLNRWNLHTNQKIFSYRKRVVMGP